MLEPGPVEKGLRFEIGGLNFNGFLEICQGHVKALFENDLVCGDALPENPPVVIHVSRYDAIFQVYARHRSSGVMEDDPVVQGKIIGDGLSVDFGSDREWTFQEKRIDCSHILAICSRRWQNACEKEQQWTND